jgi:hypothetical protein
MEKNGEWAENQSNSSVISNGEVKASPAKIEALYRFNTPKSVKEIQSFLGLAS